jgi:RNA recognition motif-containing protein
MDNGTYSVMVRNLNFRTRLDDLRPVFEEFGHVKDVHIPVSVCGFFNWFVFDSKHRPKAKEF